MIKHPSSTQFARAEIPADHSGGTVNFDGNRLPGRRHRQREIQYDDDLAAEYAEVHMDIQLRRAAALLFGASGGCSYASGDVLRFWRQPVSGQCSHLRDHHCHAA